MRTSPAARPGPIEANEGLCDSEPTAPRQVATSAQATAPAASAPPTSPGQSWSAGAREAGGDEPPRLSGRRPRLVEAIKAGYQQSPSAERVAFNMTTSFAVTIAGARAWTYLQERNRRMPAVRSLARELSQLVGDNSVRVHHSLPGTLMAFTAGGIALLAGGNRRERWLGVPFGAGVSLTMDEFRMLAGRNNPYWGGRSFAFVQCANAAVTSLAMCVDFARRGHRQLRADADLRAPNLVTGGCAENA